MMRAMLLASALVAIAPPVLAQEQRAAEVSAVQVETVGKDQSLTPKVVEDPPAPTDFSKPFQLDRSPFYGWPFVTSKAEGAKVAEAPPPGGDAKPESKR